MLLNLIESLLHYCLQKIINKLYQNITQLGLFYIVLNCIDFDVLNCSKRKMKRRAILHPRTGGGKKPSSPNLSEQLLFDNLEGRPSLCGLPCGIDTASGKYIIDNTCIRFIITLTLLIHQSRIPRKHYIYSGRNIWKECTNPKSIQHTALIHENTQS